MRTAYAEAQLFLYAALDSLATLDDTAFDDDAPSQHLQPRFTQHKNRAQVTNHITFLCRD